ncbi:hypothetical protein MAUB1S_05202 [Mycolicibacterium aubagnense]
MPSTAPGGSIVLGGFGQTVVVLVGEFYVLVRRPSAEILDLKIDCAKAGLRRIRQGDSMQEKAGVNVLAVDDCRRTESLPFGRGRYAVHERDRHLVEGSVDGRQGSGIEAADQPDPHALVGSI